MWVYFMENPYENGFGGTTLFSETSKWIQRIFMIWANYPKIIAIDLLELLFNYWNDMEWWLGFEVELSQDN